MTILDNQHETSHYERAVNANLIICKECGSKIRQGECDACELLIKRDLLTVPVRKLGK